MVFIKKQLGRWSELVLIVVSIWPMTTDKLWILPMHGSLPNEDQLKVFQRPPLGARKVWARLSFLFFAFYEIISLVEP